jgi:hypothetical protein
LPIPLKVVMITFLNSSRVVDWSRSVFLWYWQRETRPGLSVWCSKCWVQVVSRHSEIVSNWAIFIGITHHFDVSHWPETRYRSARGLST